MFTLPFMSGSPASIAPKTAEGGTLSEGVGGLFTPLDGAEAGFSGELQEMLAQLTPQMLARLESLIAGGMDLPQAARQLLSDASSMWPRDLRGALLDDRLPTSAISEAIKTDGKSLPGDGKQMLLAQAFPRLLGGEPMQALANLQAIAGAAPTAVPSSVSNAMPPQVAASLLEMGLPQQVGSRAWSGAIAERVMWMAQGDQQFARLSLNPPQLGPLEVRVAINQDQTSVTFLSSHAAVRDALDAAMPRLRELFDQQAMSLVHAEVADPGAQRDGRTGMFSPSGGRFASDDSDPNGAEDTEGLAIEHPFISARGLVDLFA